jgi:hypothetical protein
MTLVEMVVALGLAALVMAIMATMSSYSARSLAALANYTDLDRMSRNALDTMSAQIRQTRRLTEGTTNRLVFEDSDGGTLEFFYNPNAKTLRRSKNGSGSKVLLNNCQQLTFSMYQRNPVGGTYDVYPTANAANCKLIQLKWTCSRDLIIANANTESVQSSKIVIRKQ